MDPSCLVSVVQAAGVMGRLLGSLWAPQNHLSTLISVQQSRRSVMPTCQQGPKSLMTVSNTLLSLCHKELRQF